jgi:hypothetical protein
MKLCRKKVVLKKEPMQQYMHEKTTVEPRMQESTKACLMLWAHMGCRIIDELPSTVTGACNQLAEN